MTVLLPVAQRKRNEEKKREEQEREEHMPRYSMLKEIA